MLTCERELIRLFHGALVKDGSTAFSVGKKLVPSNSICLDELWFPSHMVETGEPLSIWGFVFLAWRSLLLIVCSERRIVAAAKKGLLTNVEDKTNMHLQL